MKNPKPGKRSLKKAQIGVGATESPLNNAIASRDGAVLSMVTAAVRHGDVLLAYQPVMQAEPPHDVAYFEGLLRVLDETGRIIPANEFMSVVEDSELGRELDLAVLNLGLAALTAEPDLRLALNMSARSIGYRRWGDTLDRALADNPLLGERLMLEISETSAMTMPEIVIDFMDRLQPSGIAFALDDFGSGKLMFRYFRDFFFDLVKIDGQFIKNIHADHDNQALTRALMSIAREFDMMIVAEAVETARDAQFLYDLGVDCLQGYFFGAPTIHPPWDRRDANKSA